MQGEPSRTYSEVELVGTSAAGIDQAIQSCLSRAAQTLRHLDWFEVESIRGQIVDGAIEHYQVTMKVGFRIEDPADLRQA